MRGNFGLYCSFSTKLPCIDIGLHCNANEKNWPWKGLFWPQNSRYYFSVPKKETFKCWNAAISKWIPVNSPMCKLAYNLSACLHRPVYSSNVWTMSKILFCLAQHWMKEQGISCVALSLEFIYLTARVARQWIKEQGIAHFTQLWGTTNLPIGEFTNRCRWVGLGEFAHGRVDRIPSKYIQLIFCYVMKKLLIFNIYKI